MKKYLSIATICLIALFTVFTVLTPVLALEPIPGSTPKANINNISDIFNILLNTVGWVYRAFFVIAALFIIIAAFNYLTAQGDPEKVGKAKSMIIYSVIAIVVALLAYSIDVIVGAYIANPSV